MRSEWCRATDESRAIMVDPVAWWIELLPGRLAHSPKGFAPDGIKPAQLAAFRHLAPKAVLDLSPAPEADARAKAWKRLHGASYESLDVEGDFDDALKSFIEALARLRDAGLPLIVVGGRAKGTALCGIALELAGTPREEILRICGATRSAAAPSAKDVGKLLKFAESKHGDVAACVAKSGAGEAAIAAVVESFAPILRSVEELASEARRAICKGLAKATPFDAIQRRLVLSPSECDEVTLAHAIAQLPAVARVSNAKPDAPPSFYVISNDPLIAELEAAPADDHAQIVGEFIYPYVEHTQGPNAPKLTGMLLEMDVADLLHLTEDRFALDAKLGEALEALIAAGAAEALPDLGAVQVASAIPDAPKVEEKSAWGVEASGLSVEAPAFVHVEGDWPSLPVHEADAWAIPDPNDANSNLNGEEGDPGYDEDGYGSDWSGSGSLPPGRELVDDALMDFGDGGYAPAAETSDISESSSEESSSSSEEEEDEEEGASEEHGRLLETLQAQARRETAGAGSGARAGAGGGIGAGGALPKRSHRAVLKSRAPALAEASPVGDDGKEAAEAKALPAEATAESIQSLLREMEGLSGA